MSGQAGELPLADRVAITDLVHRYAALADDREFPALAELFTADGVLAAAAPPTAMDPAHEHVGHDQIEQALAALDGLEATLHAVVGVVLDPGPDTEQAIGRVACEAHHVTLRDGEPRDLVWTLSYRDLYRRTSSGWRFARRSMHVRFVRTAPLRTVRRWDNPR